MRFAVNRSAIAPVFKFRLLIEAKDVPSLGYDVVLVAPGKRSFASDLKASGTVLENAALKVTVDPGTGCITSLYDKAAHFEALALNSCGNEVPALRWADLGDGEHGFSLIYEYNYKLQASQVGAHAGSLPSRHSFVTLGAQNVVLTALKKAEDGDALIFRFYEWAGKEGEVRVQVPEGAKSARLANLQEVQEGSPLSIEEGNTISVPSHPHEIVTVRVEYPSPTK
jgi:hypothetical protein